MRVPPNSYRTHQLIHWNRQANLAIPIQCSAQPIVGQDRLLPFRFLLEQAGRKAMPDKVESFPGLVSWEPHIKPNSFSRCYRMQLN
jgi:hypothetical protein